jgi:hypothetical protein
VYIVPGIISKHLGRVSKGGKGEGKEKREGDKEKGKGEEVKGKREGKRKKREGIKEKMEGKREGFQQGEKGKEREKGSYNYQVILEKFFSLYSVTNSL